MRQVQPMLGPAFAEGRRSQKPIDNSSPGLGRIVGEKRLQFRFGRQQAGQVISYPAEKLRLGSGPDLLDFQLTKFSENKRVNRVLGGWTVGRTRRHAGNGWEK